MRGHAAPGPIEAYSIRAENTFGSTGLSRLSDFLEAKWDSHVDQGGTQYVAITNLSRQDFEAFLAKRETRTMPTMRVKYYPCPDPGLAIIKLSSRKQETARMAFLGIIFRLLDELHITGHMLQPHGIAWQRMTSGSSKESDLSWVPLLTRSSDDFPSFVVEMGVGESLAQLRTDARIWLETSNERTKLVLLISINVSEKTITMERWEMVSGIQTRSGSRRARAQNVQTIIIKQATKTATNTPLILPIDLILDGSFQPPASSSGQILSIPASDLVDYINVVFL